MKKVSILACVLLFVAVAAFAQTSSQPPLSREALAAILGQPATGSCATQPSGVRQVAKRPAILTEKALCTATATCQFGTTVSCSSNINAANCMAVNANCPAEPGHVVCDGVTTSCPACCTGRLLSIEYKCCECDMTGDCEACCRCNGGDLAQCFNQCRGA
jgi:hypothetical protein